MDASQWMARFRSVHELIRKGGGTEEESELHRGMCEELARSMMASQGQQATGGLEARKQFRVAQVYPIEVNNLYRAVTRDVSCSAFSVVLPDAFKVGQLATFSLQLARGAEPITGQARATEVLKQKGSAKVTFGIEVLGKVASELLELALFDAVLARIK